MSTSGGELEKRTQVAQPGFWRSGTQIRGSWVHTDFREICRWRGLILPELSNSLFGTTGVRCRRSKCWMSWLGLELHEFSKVAGQYVY
ncbi:MAG: hypothetical protein AMJ58_05695 [Gammaproteobacteria bacterium SG8_30]|nr:MAG: hypothetical protein AMJ58_05695 [Gammaproteobacteria bacterium SG8_30]